MRFCPARTAVSKHSMGDSCSHHLSDAHWMHDVHHLSCCARTQQEHTQLCNASLCSASTRREQVHNTRPAGELPLHNWTGTCILMEDAHLEKTQYGVSGRLFPGLGHNDKQWTFTPLLVRLSNDSSFKHLLHNIMGQLMPAGEALVALASRCFIPPQWNA